MRRILLALAVVALAACGDTTEVTGASIAGTYTLASYNGHTLPTAHVDGGTVTAGSMVINANGTFTFNESITAGAGGAGGGAGGTITGAWTLDGSTITFDPSSDGDDNATGTVSGSQLTLTAEDAIRIYNKAS